MTDMGDDLRAQDEQSCIVYGMPREAVRLGAAQASVPLGTLAHVLQGFSPA
jgi:two-component system chemotaxis response regulator CheB